MLGLNYLEVSHSCPQGAYTGQAALPNSVRHPSATKHSEKMNLQHLIMTPFCDYLLTPVSEYT